MRVLQEEDIRQLRRQKRITTVNGEKLKPALLYKKPKVSLPPEKRQNQVLEKLINEITTIVKANDQNAVILSQIRKIKMPDFPEPAKEWEHIPIRGSDGKIERITSKRIK